MLSRFSRCLYWNRQTKILCTNQDRNAGKLGRPLWTESKSQRQWPSQQPAQTTLPASGIAIPPGFDVRHAATSHWSDDGGNHHWGPVEGPREEAASALPWGHWGFPQEEQKDDLSTVLWVKGHKRNQIARFRIKGMSCLSILKWILTYIPSTTHLSNFGNIVW